MFPFNWLNERSKRVSLAILPNEEGRIPFMEFANKLISVILLFVTVIPNHVDTGFADNQLC